MELALAEARAAAQRGEVPIGAVIVGPDGAVLATAGNRTEADSDPTGHAEILAIREACRALDSLDLAGCSLYTNVEPCWMCSFAIRETGISEIVMGVPVADIGGVTSRYPILADTAVPGWRKPPVIRRVAYK